MSEAISDHIVHTCHSIVTEKIIISGHDIVANLFRRGSPYFYAKFLIVPI